MNEEVENMTEQALANLAVILENLSMAVYSLVAEIGLTDVVVGMEFKLDLEALKQSAQAVYSAQQSANIDQELTELFDQ